MQYLLRRQTLNWLAEEKQKSMLSTSGKSSLFRRGGGLCIARAMGQALACKTACPNPTFRLA